MGKKRAFDLTLVVLGALVWVPVLALASLMVLLREGRPVYYKSNRRVSGGEVIKLTKFRTMVKNADKIANRNTVAIDNNVRFLNIPPDSPLYTPVGRLLERGGITELPQLVHVLRGDMSIVGNRPLPENVMSCLREEYPYADDRFLTKAGLTGPAQLVGRESLTDSERLKLESAYCHAARHGYSMWLDLSILLSTVMIVLGVRQALGYQGTLDLIERRSRRRSTVTVLAPESATVVDVVAPAQAMAE
ncbi:sugar transferase [Nocardioides nanhaiensis]|uniref:Bacterial sugar transferase domain-containing protein n=1 Tax=Nocardioides nanhaiensis TaxID=1476871 RepID=A0ABP8VTX6_9ACTN